MKMSFTGKCQTKEQEQEQEQESILQNTSNAETRGEQIHTSTDSLAEQNRGATRTSRSTSLKNCKLTYQDLFYRPIKSDKTLSAMRGGTTEDSQRDRANIAPANSNENRCDKWGFPNRARRMQWCTGHLKVNAQRISNFSQQGKLVYKPQTVGFSDMPQATGGKINTVTYLGIACDEPIRIERHSKDKNKILPLVDIGWTEAYCRQWCEENGLLSPIYTISARGGCWFCHNQGIDQLRLLRHDYPDLWALLLKWDTDSPVTFHADGHTVHDFDKRFQWEDEGYLPNGKRFRWDDLNCKQMNIDQWFKKNGGNE